MVRTLVKRFFFFFCFSQCWKTSARMQWLIILGLLAFTKILGMESEEAEKLCRDAVAATKNKNVHSYFPQ
jgi:hypothetical protein